MARSQETSSEQLERLADSLRDILLKRAPGMLDASLAQLDKFVDICHSVEMLSAKASSHEARVQNATLPYDKD